MISDGKCEASSHSITCGAISPSANSRTLRCSCFCSSVNVKSTMSSLAAVFSGIYTQPKFRLYSLHKEARNKVRGLVKIITVARTIWLDKPSPTRKPSPLCETLYGRSIAAPQRGNVPTLFVPTVSSLVIPSGARDLLFRPVTNTEPRRHQPTAYPFFLFCSSNQTFNGTK